MKKGVHSMKRGILAMDQGTTSSRAIIFDHSGNVLSRAQKEVPLFYPKPGWVEQNPYEIWATQMGVAGEAIQRANLHPHDLAAVGITNQRETTLVWDRKTGKPLHPAIGWQCRRSAPICERLKMEGFESTVHEKTGLLIDAYFSATKLIWLFTEYPDLKKKAVQGDLCFGTVDTWLVWNMTKGRSHITDFTNASRTMLFNIHSLQWDDQILDELGIPQNILPRVVPSTGMLAEIAPEFFGSADLAVAGMAGDQQAALFGQACFEPGMAKNTYGTGCFMLMNTGDKPIHSKEGLLTTIAWSDGTHTMYALEGSIFIAGAVVQWLRDELKLIRHAKETEALALSVDNTNGVYMVPAFTGLGAPYWDMYARGTIIGLTRDTSQAHLIRAALESIAYQTADVLDVMEKESGIILQTLRTDGGAASNGFLMQFQSDVLNRPVERSAIHETTALGAAYLAGLAVGWWKNRKELESKWHADQVFHPSMPDKIRDEGLKGWKRAVDRSREWIEKETE